MIPYAFKKVLMEFLFIKDPNKKYYFDLDLDENSKHFESKKCELIFCKKNGTPLALFTIMKEFCRVQDKFSCITIAVTWGSDIIEDPIP